MPVSHRVGRKDDPRIVPQEDGNPLFRPMIRGRDGCQASEVPSDEGADVTAAAIVAALSDERVVTNQEAAVVAAANLTRRYGEGDTAVDALRGISL
jgi:hypothetical protein